MATSVQDIVPTDIDNDITVSYHHPTRFKQRRATFEGNAAPISATSANYNATSPSSMAASHVARLAALFQSGKPMPSENLAGVDVGNRAASQTGSPRLQTPNRSEDTMMRDENRPVNCAAFPAVRPRVLFPQQPKTAPPVKSRLRRSNENINLQNPSDPLCGGTTGALLSPPSGKMREKFQARRAKFEACTAVPTAATSPRSPSAQFLGASSVISPNSKTSPSATANHAHFPVDEFVASRAQNRLSSNSDHSDQRNSRDFEPELRHQPGLDVGRRKPNVLSSKGSSPRPSSYQNEQPSLEALQFTLESGAPRIDMPILKRLSGEITHFSGGPRSLPATPPRYVPPPRPITDERRSLIDLEVLSCSNKSPILENQIVQSEPSGKKEDDTESFPFPPRKLRSSSSHRSASASLTIENEELATDLVDTQSCLLPEGKEMDSTNDANPRLSSCLPEDERSFLFDVIANNEREIARSLNGVNDARNLDYHDDEFSLDDSTIADFEPKRAEKSININGDEADGTEMNLASNSVRSILKLSPSVNGHMSSEVESCGIEVICDDDLIEVEHVKEVAVEKGVHIFDDGHFYYELDTVSMQKSGSIPESLFQHEATRVRFSEQPTIVYSTFSSNDYNRKNEDVDPISASAEFELEKRLGRMELFEVELNKGSRGLGISILGMGVGAEMGLEKLGIFIKSLTVGGAAEQSGKIQVCDQIVEVDGVNLVGVTQVFASQVLRNTNGKVSLILGRDKDPNNSDVVRLVRQSLGDTVLPISLQQSEVRDKENHKNSNATSKADDVLDKRTNDSVDPSTKLDIATSMAPLKQAMDCSELMSPLSAQEEDDSSNCDDDFEEMHQEKDGASPSSNVDEAKNESLCARCESAERLAASARSQVENLKAQVMASLEENSHLVQKLQEKTAESEELKCHLVRSEAATQKYEDMKRLLKESEEQNGALLRAEEERKAYFNNLIAGLRDRIVNLEEKIRQDKLSTKRTPEIFLNDGDLPVHTLDVSLAKQKAVLGRSGGLSGRKPPSRNGQNTSTSSSTSSEYEQSSVEDDSDDDDIAETFADQWNTIKRANQEAFKHRSASYDLNQGFNGSNISCIQDSSCVSDSVNVNNSVKFVSSCTLSDKDSSPQLIHNTTGTKSSASSGSGIQLVSVKALSDADDFPSWLNGGGLPTEALDASMAGFSQLDENSSRTKRYDVNNASFGVSQWSEDETRRWLLEGAALERPKAAADALRGVTGAELLKMDNAQLKSRGMNHSSDRTNVRKRLKELQHQQLSSSNSSKFRKIFNFGK